MNLVNRLHYAAGSDRLKDDWRTQRLLNEAARALTAADNASFRVGYRDGVKASASVCQHVREIVGATTGSSIAMALAEASDRIRKLEPESQLAALAKKVRS